MRKKQLKLPHVDVKADLSVATEKSIHELRKALRFDYSTEADRLLKDHRMKFHVDPAEMCTICFSLRRAWLRGMK